MRSRCPARSVASSRRLDRLLARAEVGREAALVAHARREAALVQQGAERVEGLGADPQCLGEARGTRRHQHELLQVDRVLRVHAAVDHVHQRHRERPSPVPAEPPEQRDSRLRCSRLRRGQRDRQDRVRAEPPLVRRAVELDHPLVERALIGRIEPPHRRRDLAVHVRDRLRDALAAPLGRLVAQLERLVRAGRRARRNRRPARSARLQPHIGLDRRVAPRVEDPAAANAGDPAHSNRNASLARSKYRSCSSSPSPANA